MHPAPPHDPHKAFVALVMNVSGGWRRACQRHVLSTEAEIWRGSRPRSSGCGWRTGCLEASLPVIRYIDEGRCVGVHLWLGQCEFRQVVVRVLRSFNHACGPQHSRPNGKEELQLHKASQYTELSLCTRCKRLAVCRQSEEVELAKPEKPKMHKTQRHGSTKFYRADNYTITSHKCKTIERCKLKPRPTFLGSLFSFVI
jgi:hypothetical protein